MGRSSSFICHTCKQEIYLGYGSYSSWLDLSYSLDEFEQKAKKLHEEYHDPKRHNWHDNDGKMKVPPDPREHLKNKNVKKCLEDHQGHKFEYSNEDFGENFEDPTYEFIDLDPED